MSHLTTLVNGKTARIRNFGHLTVAEVGTPSTEGFRVTSIAVHEGACLREYPSVAVYLRKKAEAEAKARLKRAEKARQARQGHGQEKLKVQVGECLDQALLDKYMV